MTRKTKNFAEAIRRKLAANPELAAAVEGEQFEINISNKIRLAREEAGLTQKQLADLISSHQSVIARMERADYSSHSLQMLHRIGVALGMPLELAFRRKSAAAELRKQAVTTTEQSLGGGELHWVKRPDWKPVIQNTDPGYSDQSEFGCAA